MVKWLESLNKFFRKGSKNYEVARLLLENKSYDEVMKLIPGIKRKSLYSVRGKLKELKDQGLLGNKKDVTDPPKVPDEASEESRMRTLNQFLLKKPNEQSREQIEATSKELGVKPEFLINLIEEKAKIEAAKDVDKIQVDKDDVQVTQEKREKQVISNESSRTVPISLNGTQMKVPTSNNTKGLVSTDTPLIQTAPKKLEGDSKEELVEVIVNVLDKRDQQKKVAAEEQLRWNEEEDSKALERMAKKFNVKPENLPMLLNQQTSETMLKRVNDLPGRTLSDSQKLSMLMDNLPPEQLRLMLKKKVGTIENPMLAAFKHMDTEASLIDIMDELNLDFDKAIDLQTKYNQMKRLELERQQLDEPYLKAWFDIAQVIGEVARRNCPDYHEVNGRCDKWRFDGLSKSYRDTFRGLFQAAKKKEGGFYVNVNKHPEVCGLCGIGFFKKEMRI